MRRWLWNRRLRKAGQPPMSDVDWAILREFMRNDPLAKTKRGES